MDAQGQNLFIAAFPAEILVPDDMLHHTVLLKAGQRPDPLLCTCGIDWLHVNFKYYYVLVWRFDLKEGEKRPGWELVKEYPV